MKVGIIGAGAAGPTDRPRALRNSRCLHVRAKERVPPLTPCPSTDTRPTVLAIVAAAVRCLATQAPASLPCPVRLVT